MNNMYVWFIYVIIGLVATTQATAQPLNVVTLQYPPFEYEHNGEIKGIAVEIVQEAFQRMQKPITIKFLPWKRALRMIQEGEADAIFTAAKTPERQEFAYFSNEVLVFHIASLFVRKESAIQFDGDLRRLSAYRFGVIRKASYGNAFDEAVKNNIITNLDLAENLEQNVKKLLRGRFDILVSNKYGALYVLQKMEKLHEVRELRPEIQNVPTYIAFSKKRNLASLRDEFDTVLREMKQNGTYEFLMETFLKRFSE